jgi:serine/threonine-protein kinase
VLGSPGYMSPEQLRSSRDVDVRSDIWSIGVILYELVSGKPPFSAESITELAIRVTLDPTPPLVARMPQGFDQVVNRCLAKDPAHRYPDLANLAHALAAYAGPSGWELASAVARVLSMAPRSPAAGAGPLVPPRPMRPTPPPPGASGLVPAAAPITQPAPGPPTTIGSAASSMVTGRSRSGARWGILAGIGVIVLGAGIAIAVTRGGGEPGAAAPPPAAGVTPAAQPAAPPAVEPPAPPAPPAPDAAIAAEPPDAAVETASAKPERPEQPGKPGKPEKPRKPPGKPPVKPPVKPPPGEDFGESRF